MCRVAHSIDFQFVYFVSVWMLHIFFHIFESGFFFARLRTAISTFICCDAVRLLLWFDLDAICYYYLLYFMPFTHFSFDKWIFVSIVVMVSFKLWFRTKKISFILSLISFLLCSDLLVGIHFFLMWFFISQLNLSVFAIRRGQIALSTI